ncbi:NTP hydrolase p-loop-containing [Desulfonema limicola]|uniref:NTP hydrolase p-loop-containing n=1 Tax=Desulfonema limicola TaxID=45656 RepID=A0A975GFE8_9BACT|nr:hypothetical protein [Desulfonema limicola]QTA79110.1 NTP hydrolase p-loop-containing [Desulfonema limicola]
MKNVIILGAGRTGSSPLAGLIAYKRYYIQQEAIKSRGGYPDGDYENPELIKLNQDILMESGYGYTKANINKSVNIDTIKQFIHQNKNFSKYHDFLKNCNEHSPWLWKDPRLCYTIHFWKELINFDQIKFIFITRDKKDIFRSYTKNNIYCTKKDVYQKYEEQVDSVKLFFKENNLNSLNIHSPELKNKEKLIEKLNQYLEIDIKVSDYDAVYKPNIRKKESGLHFWIRYYTGFIKIMIERAFKPL